jgi:ribosomal protein S18 acetylase RimI-like enzyme
MRVVKQHVTYRQAIKADCDKIISLYSLASDGVADYVWTAIAEPGESIHDVGMRRYQKEDTLYSYRNCTIASVENDIAGMIVAYSMHINSDAVYGSGDPVLLPYTLLEEDNSYYISGMAVFADYQGNGIGSRLLKIAESHAIEHGLAKLSLIVFEQNQGAKKLYDKTGYVEIMRHPIVPHPLIHFTGDALLMVKLLR